jgi:proteasome accessory factor B
MSEVETYEDFPPLGDDQVTERLINLVMLLTSSRFGFTKSEIAQRVPGYSDNAAAMERMFERDKRILAVNNIVLSEPSDDDDYRYKISLSSATLPEMSFSKQEQEILRAAVLAWENTSQRADAVLLKTKLETIGINSEFSRKIATFDLPLDLETVFAALSQKRILNFQYRRPEQTDTTKRELEIWGVAVRNGSWFIYGNDRIRNAVRVFNLYRVVGGFSISGEANSYEPQEVDLVELLDPKNRDEVKYVANIKLASGKGEYWRDLAGIDESNSDELTIKLELSKPSEQIPRLAADSPGVVVVGPKELVEIVSNLVWGENE